MQGSAPGVSQIIGLEKQISIIRHIHLHTESPRRKCAVSQYVSKCWSTSQKPHLNKYCFTAANHQNQPTAQQCTWKVVYILNHLHKILLIYSSPYALPGSKEYNLRHNCLCCFLFFCFYWTGLMNGFHLITLLSSTKQTVATFTVSLAPSTYITSQPTVDYYSTIQALVATVTPLYIFQLKRSEQISIDGQS